MVWLLLLLLVRSSSIAVSSTCMLCRCLYAGM